MAGASAKGSGLRCYHCAGPLSKEMETSGWNLSPLIRDSFSMIGSALGGTASAFYGFNHGSSIDIRLVWFSDLGAGTNSLLGCIHGILSDHVEAPPVIVFSSACAGLTGGAVPALAQLASSSYHAAVSSPLPPSGAQDDKMHKSRASSTL